MTETRRGFRIVSPVPISGAVPTPACPAPPLTSARVPSRSSSRGVCLRLILRFVGFVPSWLLILSCGRSTCSRGRPSFRRSHCNIEPATETRAETQATTAFDAAFTSAFSTATRPASQTRATTASRTALTTGPNRASTIPPATPTGSAPDSAFATGAETGPTSDWRSHSPCQIRSMVCSHFPMTINHLRDSVAGHVFARYRHLMPWRGLQPRPSEGRSAIGREPRCLDFSAVAGILMAAVCCRGGGNGRRARLRT